MASHRHRTPSSDQSGGLPADLVDLTDGLDVRSATRVHGGDIAVAYRLRTGDGPLFAKTHPSPSPQLFEREAAGLAALRAHAPDGLSVPQVRRVTPHGLVLEWIDVAGRRPGGRVEADLGVGLAWLHAAGRREGRTLVGGLDGETFGYLGSVEVDLTPTTDWADFYVHRRLAPLVERAVREGSLDPVARDALRQLAPRAQELCGPPEPPALLHGDLWGGNRLVDADGVNWLIDPACHWGHREVDLAMMQLFGGFGAECLEAYDATWPLSDGWRERVPWYQLAPLLVHAILFGAGYGDAALRAMMRYA